MNKSNTQISHNIYFINQYGIRNGSKDKLKQEALNYQVSVNFIKNRLPELKKAVQDWENEHQWNTLVRGLQEDLSRLQDENDMLRKKIQEMEDVEEQRQQAENSRIEEARNYHSIQHKHLVTRDSRLKIQ